MEGRQIVLGLIRFAAAAAMLLSSAHFVWMIAQYLKYTDKGFLRNWSDTKAGLDRFFDAVHGPSVWFLFAGILYVLTDLARQRRDGQPRGQAADYEDAPPVP
jgi:hypothetical protein